VEGRGEASETVEEVGETLRDGGREGWGRRGEVRELRAQGRGWKPSRASRKGERRAGGREGGREGGKGHAWVLKCGRVSWARAAMRSRKAIPGWKPSLPRAFIVLARV